MVHFVNKKDGWRKVVKSNFNNSRRQSWDVENGGRSKATGGKISSMFITEFGDKWKAKDLFFELKEFGEIVEVVISPNRDKRGRRFGFVRYLNVPDVDLLAVKIDNVMLEGRKLFANIPRFHRIDKSKMSNNDPNGNTSGKSVFSNGKGSVGRTGQGWVDNRSFVDVMLNRKVSDGRKGNAGRSKFLSLTAEEDDMARYSRAFTGTLKDAATASALKRIFVEEGIFSIRVTSLGPNLCLLEDLVYGEVEIFIEERRVWWQQWFSRIEPWKSSDIDTERFAWIIVRGIPCHAWGSKLFKMIANLFGSFIKCDDVSNSRIKMEEARIFIKTGHQPLINEVCMASVNGSLYNLFVQEDLFKIQPQVQKSLITEEEFSEDTPSPSEIDTSEEEGVNDSDVHSTSMLSSAAHLGNDGIGDGSGTVEVNLGGGIVREHQRLSGNLVNTLLKEKQTIPAFAESSSSDPISMNPSYAVPKVSHASEFSLAGSGRKMGSDFLSKRQSNFSTDSIIEGGTHSNGLGAVKAKGPLTLITDSGNVAFSKPKSSEPLPRKKKKNMQSLGNRIVPSPSFYSALAPRKSNSTIPIGNEEKKEDEDDADSSGTFVPCNSHTDSEVMHCNKRLLSAPNSELEVGWKMWKSIEKLGVVSGEEESITVRKIERLELRDNLGAKGRMVHLNGSS